MRLQSLSLLSTAAVLLLSPSLVKAQSGSLASEAPGVVVLDRSLDAHKLTAGGSFQTKLINTVHLSNGKEIPKGATIVGTVVNDDSQAPGQTKLALRFASATKKGEAIPIKATIVAVSTQFQPVENNSDATEAVMQVPNDLHGQSDKTDQALDSHTTLHSDVSSTNSGVLVSDKDDIKLPEGTKMELAIAPGQ